MKNLNFILVTALVGLVVVTAVFLYGGFQTTTAKNSALQWEYCAITGSYLVNNSGNQSVIEGAVNICYLQLNGCKNEEVTSEVIYNKFIQDVGLENTENSKYLAWNRAKDWAFSKAVAKLGSDGWELIDAPLFKFDEYVPKIQGGFSVYPTSKSIERDIYFKRLKQ